MLQRILHGQKSQDKNRIIHKVTYSRQEFFDQPVSQIISDGQRFTRASLGARDNATCSMVKQCQVNWQITIHKNSLALQLNLGASPATQIATLAYASVRVNFNVQDNPYAGWARKMQIGV
ncbi:MAG: hypothetical protein EZS28_033910 [Streblomastix strix]|uniref:Uncharacterized protein n=1 Tax=Streblomastix strix TaxID=222440 RepID=A0A5J4UK08_9EUKA|nr:MAG: hypothetical protein EZS28_033910 [Streblomastix strix]